MWMQQTTSAPQVQGCLQVVILGETEVDQL